jgi:predicted acylesterase/phospholipase RssA
LSVRSKWDCGKLDDPTNTIALRNLLRGTLQDVEVKRFLAHLKQKRIALVLSGGGGKGAFEAGVLTALYDLELRELCSIAGTSVGALNAALYHQMCHRQERNIAINLWSQMQRRKIMRISRFALLKLFLYAPLAWSAIGQINIAQLFFSGTPSYQYETRVAALAKRIITVIFVYALVTIFWLVWLAVGSAVILYYIAFAHEMSWQVNIVLVMVIVLDILPFALRFAARRLSFFGNTPLENMITKNVEPMMAGVPPPVMVTLSPYVRPLSLLSYSPGQAPEYINLQCSDPELTQKLLLQTAALPEIFPARAICGELFVDGGLADNTPILGVADDRPDVVIAIYLDHRVAVENDLRVAEAKRLRKLCSNLRVSWEGALADWFWSVQFLPIIPNRSLRGWQGTLDFSEATAQKLIVRGYEDCLCHLREAASR